MSSQKTFKSSMFGFDKRDVSAYIERILKEFDEKLNEKDKMIISLKNQLKDIKAEYDILKDNSMKVKVERNRIAEVLINAKKEAESIIEEAKIEAQNEKLSLEETIEAERERLVDIKKELRDLKKEAAEALLKYQANLSSIVNDEEGEDQGA